MRIFIAMITVMIMACWVGLFAILLGWIELEWLVLRLPGSMAEFSDATGVLNGLFSSFAVLLALVAVLLQGRELKEATMAQYEQAASLNAQLECQQSVTDAIIEQLKEQQKSNAILLFQVRQQYHLAEVERMDGILDKIKNENRSDNLFQNCVDKKSRHKKQLDVIQRIMEELE